MNKNIVKGIGEFLEYCANENETDYTRTTSKVSRENTKRLKTISDENENITQAKVVNFALNTFFDEYIDKEIIDYKCNFKQICESFTKNEGKTLDIISQLIYLARNYKRSNNSQIAQNCISTIELVKKLFDFTKINNIEDFNTAKGYFLGNLSWFTSPKEMEFRKFFEENYSLEAMKSLIVFMISDKDNIEDQKYEFALRNIEVTFANYLHIENTKEANVNILLSKHIDNIKNNLPTIFYIDDQLDSYLEILSKPFHEVLKNIGNIDYDGCKALGTIHSYLGGGNNEKVRNILRVRGIVKEYSDSDLNQIYYNLTYLFMEKSNDDKMKLK